MPKTEKTLAPGLYATPFSKAYWHDAVCELKKTKMLAVAAVMIAVRVALKGLPIPTGIPNLQINLGFFVNALGASIFGPVVALLAAAVSDTLGCILFSSGPYFFPFIVTELAGSLIFALFLYRAPRSSLRVILSRFCVCFFVNIVIQTPIMMLYYDMVLGKSYAWFDLPRIIKNLVLFPLESLLLILFLNAVSPVTYRMKLTYAPPEKLRLTKRSVALVLALFLTGSLATASYGWYSYNTTNHATQFSDSERAGFNRTLTGNLALGEGEIALVNRYDKTLFSDEATVTYTVYRYDPKAGNAPDADTLYALKNSQAAGDKYAGVLEKSGSGEITVRTDDLSIVK